MRSSVLMMGLLLPVVGQTPDPSVYDFGKVMLDARIEHTFTFRNDSGTPLEIERVKLTPPLVVTRMSARVEPGAEAAVTVQMKQPLPRGDFEGGVVVQFKDPERDPVEFFVNGKIVGPVEFVPHNLLFLSTQRGQPKPASIEILNHEPDPMDISTPQCNTARFDCDLRVLEPGRRFELTVTLKGEGPAAQQADTILLPTSSRDYPLLEVKAFSKIRERVYAFPDSIDLDTIDVDYLKNHPQMTGFLTQGITVYRQDGEELRVTAETDLRFLRLSIIASATYKDRVEVRVTVDPAKLKSGEVQGSITIGTNDAEFPQLVIPVTGRIQGNW